MAPGEFIGFLIGNDKLPLIAHLSFSFTDKGLLQK
jgi:hypothetical protein